MSGLNPVDDLEVKYTDDEAVSGSSANHRLIVPEWFMALTLTLLAVFLHAVFFVKAGGFWRDEANSIALALRPTLMDTWASLKFDSFPLLHFLVVRFWAEMFGSGDVSLRALGFTVGMMIVAALWFNSREFGVRPPLIPLLLMGLSPVMVRSFATIRPNGLAALTIILAFTAVWRVIRKPDVFRMTVATLTLVFCVQTLYQNAILVLAIGLAAMVIGFLDGGFRRTAFIAVPFCVAAISLVPYAGHLHETQNWSPVAKNPITANSLLTAFIEALSSPSAWSMGVWAAVVLLAIAGAVRGLLRRGVSGERDHTRDLLLYCGITFVTALAGFLLFFVFVVGAISFQPWHCVPLLVLSAVSLAPLAEQGARNTPLRIGCLLLTCAAVVTMLVPAARNLAMRMTSMDLVAATVGQESQAGDLVIVSPWYLGGAFSRYYRGSAPWMTFPSLPETAFHRYDLLKKRMEQPETIAEEMTRIAATLRQGGRIWVVGKLEPVGSYQPIAPLPPAPLPVTGWSSAPYLLNWSQHLTTTLAFNTIRAQMVPVHTDQKVNPLEAPSIVVFEGLR